jgi:hypothetical protein
MGQRFSHGVYKRFGGIMTRLDLLKQEREVVKGLKTLSFGLKEKCMEWYDNEIECIEKYHSLNPEVDLVKMTKQILGI